MPINVWTGKAPRVQQITTVTVAGTLNGETFTISVKHPSGLGSAVQIATFVDVDHSVTTMAAALVSQWNLSHHPWADGLGTSGGPGSITASNVAGVITFTADVVGVPFVLSLNTPGGSATFTQTTGTAASGPQMYGCLGNWSLGVAPIAADNVVVTGAVNVIYDLSQASIAIAGFTCVDASGQIGSPGFPLTIAPTSFTYDCGVLGYVDIGSAAISLRIVKTSSQLPYGLYIKGSAIATCRVERQASVAIAYALGDTATVTTVENEGRCCVGAGCTNTNFKNLQGGSGEIRNTAAMTLLENNSDTSDVWDYGTGARTTVTNNAFGTIWIVLVGTAGRTITNLNAYDGAIDATKSRVTNTYTNSTRHRAAAFRMDPNTTVFTNATSEFGSTMRGTGGTKGGYSPGFGA